MSDHRAPGGKTLNDRISKNMRASKKPEKASVHGKFRDLKARKNPKGGTTTPITSSLHPSLGLVITDLSGGGSVPKIGSTNVTKVTGSSSPGLYQA
jgi:hypothetical protein